MLRPFYVCMLFKVGLSFNCNASYSIFYLTHLALPTEMPGRRFRLSVHRKNEERTCKALPVSIELTREVMVFRVSIPLILLKYVVSLPISIYLSSPVVSPQALRARLQTRALPPSWVIAPASTMDSLVLCKLRYDSSHSIADVLFIITINCHLGWHVMLCGSCVDLTKNEFLSSLPRSICSFVNLVHILESLDSCRICIGNSEDKFLNVVRHRNSTPKGERVFCTTFVLKV